MTYLVIRDTQVVRIVYDEQEALMVLRAVAFTDPDTKYLLAQVTHTCTVEVSHTKTTKVTDVR